MRDSYADGLFANLDTHQRIKDMKLDRLKLLALAADLLQREFPA